MKSNHCIYGLFLLVIFMLSCSKERSQFNTGVNDISDIVLCEMKLEIEEDSMSVLNATVQGGTPPYIYEWSTGETTSSIEISSAEVYSVSVQDAIGCILIDSISIDPCAAFVLSIVENPMGTYTANASGGTAPYSYLWSTGEASISIMDTVAPMVSVSVIDAQNCVADASSITSTSSDCQDYLVELEENPPGTINTLISGGIPPYSFFWSNGESTSSIVADSEGSYGVIVLDETGCLMNVWITIE